MPLCLIGMGANLGEPAETLRTALDALSAHSAIELVAASSFLETKPIGGPVGQGTFLNACATIRTDLSPQETIGALLDIEASLGRTRRTRWEARKLDLDLLLYGDAVCREQGVEIPHPRMASRRFVLDPAAEIAAGMIHPITGWTIGQMARSLREAPNVAMLTGLPGVDRALIAESLEKRAPSLTFSLAAFHDSSLGSFTERRTILRKAFAAARPISFYRSSTSVLDFWPGESLLWTEENSSDEAIALPFVKRPQSPKLLIDLYLPDEDPSLAERWAQILKAHAPAPWIRVNAANQEAAEVEILAALQAMQG
jgi:2-amino-4-hydroxy-6-hydroxymethyldihydropteridine diphosphokinase